VNVSGRSALVTGASGGLGHAIARGLAECGARVVLSARRTDVLEELASEIGASVIACDLTDAASTGELVARASEVDLLVANAGLDSAEDLLELSAEQITRVPARVIPGGAPGERG
jgi:NADP-dependent 3-hydroxy acid dehydrogenase YdfG